MRLNPRIKSTLYIYIHTYTYPGVQGMVETLIKIAMCCGMEMNVEKSQVMKISRKPPLGTDYVRSKTAGVCGIYQLLE
jgi:hypothetical protein